MQHIILEKIREINKEKPAYQADLLSSLNLEHDELVIFLNSLHDEGKITAKNKRVNRSLAGPKILDFAYITAIG